MHRPCTVLTDLQDLRYCCRANHNFAFNSNWIHSDVSAPVIGPNAKTLAVSGSSVKVLYVVQVGASAPVVFVR